MRDKLATDRNAEGILKALGLEDKHVRTLSLHFAAGRVVIIKVEYNLTEEQMEGVSEGVTRMTKGYHLIEIEEEKEITEAREEMEP